MLVQKIRKIGQCMTCIIGVLLGSVRTRVRCANDPIRVKRIYPLYTTRPLSLRPRNIHLTIRSTLDESESKKATSSQ
jgi:hypothetical protein